MIVYPLNYTTLLHVHNWICGCQYIFILKCTNHIVWQSQLDLGVFALILIIRWNHWPTIILPLILNWKNQPWTVDRFTKTYFWNFQNIRAVLCYILIDKQMLEKAFCSNIAPSLSSGTHLFYKAEYMGRSYLNQVWGITFDWSALANWIFRCQVLSVRWHEKWASGVSLKSVIKMQFRNAYFRSLVHSSQKLWPKPD